MINPLANGECILNRSQIISTGASFSVQEGKKFRLTDALFINNNSSAANFGYYFNDTTTNKEVGADTAKTSELLNVPFIEDLDISLIPSLLRPSSSQSILKSSFIDVPFPTKNKQIGPSCVGWAIGYGILGFYNSVLERNSGYEGPDKVTSPTYIWNQLYNPQNIDEGTSIPKALELVQTKGCCKWYDMPGDDAALAVPLIAVKNAANYINSNFKWYQAKTVDIDKIKYFVDRNQPVPFGCKVDLAFKRGGKMDFLNEPDGRFVWMNYDDIPLEKHAMVICGYDDNINAFRVLNSWGTGWGNGGFIWIDYDFFKESVLKHSNGQPEIYFFNY
jgi:hypothetical protein